MKIVSIETTNFMRYVGENRVDFSCDPSRNVTVILGDNTAGKTTLAQAFRWGLYEDLIDTSYAKKKDIVLLSNEVAASLKFGLHATVKVVIHISEGETQWKFTRSVKFRKKTDNPKDISVLPVGEPELTMQIYENGVWGPVRNNNGYNSGKDKDDYKKGCVDEAINNLLPRNLSSYFFFDGERWSDAKLKKEEIKNSINTILGITGLLEMKKHLKDGRDSVYKTLQKKLKGSDGEYERLQKELDSINDDIAKCEEDIARAIENYNNYVKDRDRLREDLANNQRTLDDIKRVKDLESSLRTYQDNKTDSYGDIIKRFSESSARYFAASFLPEIRRITETLELEGKDIPGVTVDTIEYLIAQGKCLCGEDLTEGSKAYKALMDLKKVIPPEQIGGAVGKFESTLEAWAADYKDLIPKIEELADRNDTAIDRIDELTDEKESVERRIDRKINVEGLTKSLRAMEQSCEEERNKRARAENRKEILTDTWNKKNEQLRRIAETDKENAGINRALSYVQAIYNRAQFFSELKEKTVFEDLNGIIATNFDKMFDDKEKYAALEEDYKVHVYYRNLNGLKGHEATVLSNGEATAINFVYIVSVLELAKKRKVAELESDDADAGFVMNLPLVLDGPFSTLSGENTSLVACKLPEFAEQVIIFMLDKDWNSSGLDKFTDDDYCYRVVRVGDSNSSEIVKA